MIIFNVIHDTGEADSSVHVAHAADDTLWVSDANVGTSSSFVESQVIRDTLPMSVANSSTCVNLSRCGISLAQSHGFGIRAVPLP